MNLRRWLTIPLLLGITQLSFSHPTYIGRSGAPGLQSCAASCHGLPGGTITVSGFPETYTPDSTYLLTIGHNGGLPIKNFNASCRVGTGTSTAGLIVAGTGTATYGIPAEPNGIHLSTLDLNTATFSWTAPEPGTGMVRFFMAGHQGARNTGPNTNLILVANEAVIPLPPDSCTNPLPENESVDNGLNVDLSWEAGEGAEWYQVYFGTTNEPPLVSSQTDLTYDPGVLMYETTYFWQVGAMNDIGETRSELWSFVTMPEPNTAETPAMIPDVIELGPAYPNPFNATVTIPFSVPQTGFATVSIFDVLGREIARPAQGIFAAGGHDVKWIAPASGLYFVKFESGGEALFTKIVAMK